MPGFWRNAGGRVTDALLPGDQYNRATGRFRNIGRGLVGLAGQMGAGYVAGPVAGQYAGRKLANWVNRNSAGLNLTDPAELGGGAQYTPSSPGSFGLNPAATNPNVSSGPDYSPSTGGSMQPSSYSPGNFGLNPAATTPNVGAGPYPVSDAGSLQPSTFTPGDFALNPAATDVRVGGGTGGGGGGATVGGRGGYSGFTGNRSGGTLGGGTAVDPSQWGQFGFGGTDAGNGGIGLGAQLARYGGMSDVGGAGANPRAAALRGGMILGRRPPGGVPGNTGIVPPHMMGTGGIMQANALAGPLRRGPIGGGGGIRG